MKNKKVLLIDLTTLLDDSSDMHLEVAIKELSKRIIQYILDDDAWDLVIVGFEDLVKNLIEIGFSSMVIDQIKDKIEFYTIQSKENIEKFDVIRWNLIDDVIYEEEPEVFLSFNYLNGLPTIKGIKHTYTDTKTILFVNEVPDLLNLEVNIFKFIKKFLELGYKRKMWTGVKDVEKIITNTEFTKRKLVSKSAVKEDQVSVVYSGGLTLSTIFDKEKSKEEVEEILNRFDLKGSKYIYTDHVLNDSTDYERLSKILKMVLRSRDEGIPEKFLFINDIDFYKGSGEEIEAKTQLGQKVLKIFREQNLLDKVSTTGLIDKDEAGVLVMNSDAYLNYSGVNRFSFGLINAMHNSKVLILSNRKIFEEVAQDAAFYIDNSGIKKVSDGIKEYLRDEALRKKHIDQTINRVEDFSWDKASKKLIEEIKAV